MVKTTRLRSLAALAIILTCFTIPIMHAAADSNKAADTEDILTKFGKCLGHVYGYGHDQLKEVAAALFAINVNTACDEEGNTFLHLAAGGVPMRKYGSGGEYPGVYFEGNPDMTHYLIKLRAEINKPNHNGQTPLMYALAHSYCGSNNTIPSIKTLLKAHASLRARDNAGNTALHCLLLSPSRWLPCFLLNDFLKINPYVIHIKNNHGQTPLDIAVAHGDNRFTRILLPYAELIPAEYSPRMTKRLGLKED